MKSVAMFALVLLLSSLLAGCTGGAPREAVQADAVLEEKVPQPQLQEVHEVDEERYKDPQSRFLVQLMNRMVRATKD